MMLVVTCMSVTRYTKRLHLQSEQSLKLFGNNLVHQNFAIARRDAGVHTI